MKTKITLFALLLVVTNKFYAQWVEIQPGINENFPTIDCVDGTNCFVGGNLNTLMKTTDGETWTNVDVMGTPGGVPVIKMFSKDTVFIVKNGSIFKTNDGGTSWTEFMQTLQLANVNFITQQIAWGSVNGYLYKSIDGGENWTWQNTLPGGYKIGLINFLTNQIGVATLSNDQWATHHVYKTINGGIDWFKVFNGTSSQFLKDICFASSNIGYIVGSKGLIIKTIDGGEIWNDVVNPFSNSTINFVSVDFINDLSGYVIGTQGKIIKTTNGGITWLDESVTITANEDVKVASLDTVYIATSAQNLILKNSNADLILKIIENKNSKVALYPNPSKFEIIINGLETNSKIVIYDLIGNEIISEDLQGFKQNKIDVSRMNLGVYYYKIIDTNNAIIKNGEVIKI